jgi:hypothetical protein
VIGGIAVGQPKNAGLKPARGDVRPHWYSTATHAPRGNAAKKRVAKIKR